MDSVLCYKLFYKQTVRHLWIFLLLMTRHFQVPEDEVMPDSKPIVREPSIESDIPPSDPAEEAPPDIVSETELEPPALDMVSEETEEVEMQPAEHASESELDKSQESLTSVTPPILESPIKEMPSIAESPVNETDAPPLPETPAKTTDTSPMLETPVISITPTKVKVYYSIGFILDHVMFSLGLLSGGIPYQCRIVLAV